MIVAQVIMGISFVVTGLVTSVPLILARLRSWASAGRSRAAPSTPGSPTRSAPSASAASISAGTGARIFTLVGIGAAVGLALVDLAADRRRRSGADRARSSPRLRHAGVGIRACGARGALGAPLDDAHRTTRRQAHPGAADSAPHPRDHVLRRNVERERRPALGGSLPHEHRRAGFAASTRSSGSGS